MEQKNHKKRPALGWSLALAYLGTLLLVVLAALVVLAVTVCNENFMKSQVKKTGFSDAVYELLADNYSSYAAATGFDAALLTDRISAAQIQADMEASIGKLYAGDTAFDTREEFYTAVFDAMQADLQGRGVEITDTVKNGVIIVADACRKDYASYVSVPLSSQLYTLVTKLRSVLWLGIAFAAVCGAMALILTVRLAPDARTGVRCLVFLFSAAAVLCLLAAFAFYPVLGLDGLKLEPASMKQLLLGYIRNLLGRFGAFGGIYGVAAALAAWAGALRGRTKRSGEKTAKG